MYISSYDVIWSSTYFCAVRYANFCKLKIALIEQTEYELLSFAKS